MKWSEKNISVDEGWINVQGIGAVGMWNRFDKEVRMDYSMKFILNDTRANDAFKAATEEEVIAGILKKLRGEYN